ncbi:MAG TPA: hypothetical protein VLE91_02540 [Candidatus Saccharimonadales bacterium]|nr:hypothetical protein [Candidatus Saccharimonadales bacterium]
MSNNLEKSRLNELTLDIEFLLISVVQGVALGFLASEAGNLVTELKYEYFVYIVSAFLFILVFWSGAIIHSISFVKWPLDLYHNFLYFLAGLVEVMAFSQMDHPLRWFIFVLGFFVVSGVAYIVDLNLIKSHKGDFENSQKGKALFKHILERQIFELKFLVPGGIIFSAVCIGLIFLYPQFFIEAKMHIVLGVLQVVFGLIMMVNFMGSYKMRSKLISEAIV